MTRGTNRLVGGGSIKMGQRLVNGITTAYEDVGAGENVLVLVHGHPFNRTMWRPQVEWIENLNRARARSERVESLEEVVRAGDKGPAELVAPPNLEHEDEDERGERPWRVIV